MAKPATRGWRRLFNATGYSAAGFAWAWRQEAAFRLELVLALMLAPLGLALGDSGIERALLVGSLLLVLVVELINSSIEAVVDRVGIDRHVLAGAAKDLGSAAVFVTLMNVVVVWALVLM